MRFKTITFKVSKTATGYDVEWSKPVNLISYGPGENESIIEKHDLHVMKSSIDKAITRIIKEEL